LKFCVQNKIKGRIYFNHYNYSSCLVTILWLALINLNLFRNIKNSDRSDDFNDYSRTLIINDIIESKLIPNYKSIGSKIGAFLLINNKNIRTSKMFRSNIY
jgi:hypothetical protein